MHYRLISGIFQTSGGPKTGILDSYEKIQRFARHNQMKTIKHYTDSLDIVLSTSLSFIFVVVPTNGVFQIQLAYRMDSV